MIDLTGGKVTRGRLVNARTGDSLVFSLNPNKIKIGQGSNLAEDPLPGASTPLMRWMSGKARSISFQLQIDGEMILRVLGQQMGNAANVVEDGPMPTWGVGKPAERQAVDPKSYDITNTLQWLDRFTYPVDPTHPTGTDGERGAPDLLIFIFGSYFTAADRWVMENLSHDIIEFNPNLGPTKSNTDMTLKLYSTSTQYAHEVFRATNSNY